MMTTTMKLITVAAWLLMISTIEAFSINSFRTKRSCMTMKRGRGSFMDEGGAGKKKSSPKASGDGFTSWIPVQGMNSGIKDLPTEEGKVKLVDTMARPLVNMGTNPNGAVAIVKYGPSIYCTNVACSSCKIPLDKATVLEPNEETGGSAPRIACAFCQATYNLSTGERVASANKGGMMSGLVKGLFSKQEGAKLPVYALGEKEGQVLINLGS